MQLLRFLHGSLVRDTQNDWPESDVAAARFVDVVPRLDYRQVLWESQA